MGYGIGTCAYRPPRATACLHTWGCHAVQRLCLCQPLLQSVIILSSRVFVLGIMASDGSDGSSSTLPAHFAPAELKAQLHDALLETLAFSHRRPPRTVSRLPGPPACGACRGKHAGIGSSSLANGVAGSSFGVVVRSRGSSFRVAGVRSASRRYTEARLRTESLYPLWRATGPYARARVRVRFRRQPRTGGGFLDVVGGS